MIDLLFDIGPPLAGAALGILALCLAHSRGRWIGYHHGYNDGYDDGATARPVRTKEDR